MCRKFIQNAAIENEKNDQLLQFSPSSNRNGQFSGREAKCNFGTSVVLCGAHFPFGVLEHFVKPRRGRFDTVKRHPAQVLCDKHIFDHSTRKSVGKRRHIWRVRNDVIFDALGDPILAFLESDGVDVNVFRQFF